MFNKTLSKLAEMNDECHSNLQTVMYYAKDDMFVATNGHLMLCKNAVDFHQASDAFFPETGLTYPNIAPVIGQDFTIPVDIVSQKVYKRKKRSSYLANKITVINQEIMFNTKYLALIEKTFGKNGKWFTEKLNWCFKFVPDDNSGFALLMKIRMLAIDILLLMKIQFEKFKNEDYDEVE